MPTYYEQLLDMRNRHGWDNKDWSRAIRVDRNLLDNLQDMEITEDIYQVLKDATDHAADISDMLRFKRPVCIVSCNHKGGSGKSTIAAGTAAVLADKGYNVLVVDSDNQMNLTSQFLRGHEEETEEKNLYKAFISESSIKDQILPTDYENIYMVAGNTRMASIDILLASQMQTGQCNPDQIFKKIMKDVNTDDFFDFIIVDTSAEISITNRSLMCGADYLLYVAEGSLFHLTGIMDIQNLFEDITAKSNPGLKVLGVVFNKVNPRKLVIKKAKDALDGMLPDSLFEAYIRNDATVETTQWNGEPLSNYKRSNAWKDISAVTEEMLERIRKDM